MLQTLINAHSTGLTPEHLALIYELPLETVKLLLAPAYNTLPA